MKAPFHLLPASVQDVVKLALAPNATAEIRAAAAEKIVEDVPLGKLKAFALEIIVLSAKEGGES